MKTYALELYRLNVISGACYLPKFLDNSRSSSAYKASILSGLGHSVTLGCTQSSNEGIGLVAPQNHLDRCGFLSSKAADFTF
jgi:hypothetical protein